MISYNAFRNSLWNRHGRLLLKKNEQARLVLPYIEAFHDTLANKRHILFICKGNICRSPYAEAKARQLLAQYNIPDIEVSSAGVSTSNNFPSNLLIQNAAQKRGIDLTDHKTRKVTATMLHQADLVVVMDHNQRAILKKQFMYLPQRVAFLGAFSLSEQFPLTIEDPYGRPAGATDFALSHIDAAVEKLVQLIIE